MGKGGRDGVNGGWGAEGGREGRQEGVRGRGGVKHTP